MKRPDLRLLLPCFAGLVMGAPARADWPVNGIPVDTSAGSPSAAYACVNTSGQDLLTWRTSTPDNRWTIKVQRFTASGATPWGESIEVLHDPAGPFQSIPLFVVPDADQGAIVGYRHSSGESRVQRYGSSGRPLWGADGQPFPRFDDALEPSMVLALEGGDFVVLGNDGDQLLAQRYSGETGTPVWTRPTEVCKGPDLHRVLGGTTYGPWMSSDGTGGMVATWLDSRGVYVQRIAADGTVLWGATGAGVSAGPDYFGPYLASDGQGGAIVAWEDGTFQAHVQRVVDGQAQWGPSGAQFAGFPILALAADGKGGAWLAVRSPESVTGPVVVHHLTRTGAVADPPTSVEAGYLDAGGRFGDGLWLVDQPFAGTGHVTAHVVAADGTESAAPAGFTLLDSPTFAGLTRWSIAGDLRGGLFAAFADRRLGGPEADLYAARIQLPRGRSETRPRAAVSPRVQPWPSALVGPGTALHFALPDPQRVDLRIVSIDGRIVRRLLTDVTLAAGPHEVSWDGTGESGGRVAAGVYFATLRDAFGVASARIVVLR